VWNFFGLETSYSEQVYEAIFLLIYHMKFSFSEVYSLPIQLRTWFIKRLAKQFKNEEEAKNKK